MSNKKIRYGTLLYEVNSNEGNSVSLIESPGLFSFSTKYGNYKSPVTDDVLSIPEIIEDNNAVKYTVTEIKESVFDNNTILRQVRIPKSVVRIEWCFWKCTNLESIKVDSENPAYCDVEGVLYTKDCAKLIAYPNKHGKEYKVRDGTIIIDHFAFKNTDITAIDVPPSLQKIQTNAFYRCSSLRYISARSIIWPIYVAPMIGDHGDVNPLFHYSLFSVRMTSHFHEPGLVDTKPTNGTVVESLQNGLTLVAIEHNCDIYYGVGDKQSNWILKPIFSRIRVHYNLFFEASIHIENKKRYDESIIDGCEQKEIWFDIHGNRIHEKQLIKISKSLVLYDLSGKGFYYNSSGNGTLYSVQGELLLNSIEGYRGIEGYFFFVINGKIGIYDDTGNMVVPIEYDSFNNVSFCQYNPYPHDNSDGKYEEYVFNNVFDTDKQQNNNELGHITIKKCTKSLFSKSGVSIGMLPEEIESFSFQNPFILHGEKHSLFSLKTGIVHDCIFDGIYPIAVNWYVVKDGHHYGVFNLDSQRLVVPCLYDRIQYQ